MGEGEIKESLPNIIGRLKLTLVNAKDAKTDQGYDTYLLVAMRIVEKLEKELGFTPTTVESFRETRKMKIKPKKPPVIFIGERLKCGRRKQECSHTRARKPHSCGKMVEGECYSISNNSLALQGEKCRDQ